MPPKKKDKRKSKRDTRRKSTDTEDLSDQFKGKAKIEDEKKESDDDEEEEDDVKSSQESDNETAPDQQSDTKGACANPEIKLDTALEYLKIPAIMSGRDYIYPLWRKLIKKWLNIQYNKIYLVTPFIDPERLKEICEIVSEQPKKGIQLAILVRENCFHQNNLDQVQDVVEKKIGKGHAAVTKPVFERMCTLEYFHAKFIACIHGKKAEVLVTSANFTYSHFSYDNQESVMYIEMKEDEYRERFLTYFEKESQELRNLKM